MADCGSITTDIKEASASGVGSVAVSAPTVFTYPKQAPNDSGRMLAISSLVGGFIDAILGGDGVANAAAAENSWKDILDNVMKARGTSELNRADTERNKLPTFETDLSTQLTEYRARADSLWPDLLPIHNNIMAQVNDRQFRADAQWGEMPLMDQVLKGEIVEQGTKSDQQWALMDPMDQVIKGEIVEQATKSDSEWVAKDTYDFILNNEINERRLKSNDLWNELPGLDGIIHSAIQQNADRADAEQIHSEVLCTNDAFAKLCEFVACGYVPDYNGIADRARADAELAATSAYEEACRTGKRYNMRRGASAQLDVRLATLGASIGATAAAREKERQFAFSTNHDMRFKHATALEQARMGRRELALKYDDRRNQTATERYNNHQKASIELDIEATNMATERWKSHTATSLDLDQRRQAMATERYGAHARITLEADQRRQQMATERWSSHSQLAYKLDAAAVEMLRQRWESIAQMYLQLEGKGDSLSEKQWGMFAESAFKSLREGGEMLASAAQAYQFLAASIRATAKQGGGGTGGVVGALATLATVLPMFSGECDVVGGLGGLLGIRGQPQQCCA